MYLVESYIVYSKSVILDALDSFYWSSTSSYDDAWSNYIYESSLSSNDKNECALLCFVDGNCDFYVYQDGYCCLGDSDFSGSPNLEPDFTPTSAEILFKRGKLLEFNSRGAVFINCMF